MGTTTGVGNDAGVAFTSGDGLVTARDIESGVAASGSSKPIALARLADALRLHAGGGEPIEDEHAFLRELGIDSEEIDEDESPPTWL